MPLAAIATVTVIVVCTPFGAVSIPFAFTATTASLREWYVRSATLPICRC